MGTPALISLTTYFLVFLKGSGVLGQGVQYVQNSGPLASYPAPVSVSYSGYSPPGQFIVPAIIKPLIEPVQQVVETAPAVSNCGPGFPGNPGFPGFPGGGFPGFGFPGMQGFPPMIFDDDDDNKWLLYFLLFAMCRGFGGNGGPGGGYAGGFGGYGGMGGFGGGYGGYGGGCGCGGGCGGGCGCGCGGGCGNGCGVNGGCGGGCGCGCGGGCGNRSGGGNNGGCGCNGGSNNGCNNNNNNGGFSYVPYPVAVSANSPINYGGYPGYDCGCGTTDEFAYSSVQPNCGQPELNVIIRQEQT